jgi:predicted Fe-S protein YdhL (DUF1289 family)
VQDQNRLALPETSSDGRPRSPCVNICKLDTTGTMCIGCRRNLDEISRWLTMSQGERDDIWRRLRGAATADRDI